MANRSKQESLNMVFLCDWMLCRYLFLSRMHIAILCAVLVLLVQGCQLDRTGGAAAECTGGVIECGVSEIDYKFTTNNNYYRFNGFCRIKPVSEPETGFQYTVKGVFVPSSYEWAESGESSGAMNKKFASMGVSMFDPWLMPNYPMVGVTSYTGDPYYIAKKLCIDDIHPEFYTLPFSRNVIKHILTNNQRKDMLAQAKNPEPAPPPPPPPPCPQGWLTGPPELVVPIQGTFYGENAKSVSVLLRTRCGVDNIKYEDKNGGLWSWYIPALEYEEGGSWIKYDSPEIKMSPAADGGSHGAATLSLKGPGHWRIRAKQLTTQMPHDEVIVSESTEWIHFWVGKPQLNISKIDISMVTRVDFENTEFQQMDSIWKSGNFTAIKFKPLFRESRFAKTKSISGKESAMVEQTKSVAGLQSKPEKINKRHLSRLDSTAGSQHGRQQIERKSKTQSQRTQIAKVDPKAVKIQAPKLEFEDAKRAKTIELLAGETPELIFVVQNSGDLASKNTTFSLTCKKLSNSSSKCPSFNKRGSLKALSPKGRHNIRVNLSAVVTGEYELKLNLANGSAQTVKLRVAAKTVTVKPDTTKITPKGQSERRVQ